MLDEIRLPGRIRVGTRVVRHPRRQFEERRRPETSGCSSLRASGRPSKPAATEPKAKTKRGFAAMDKRSLRKLARQGGQAAHAQGVAPTFTKETAREAGKKGGNTTAQDREHMREIGRKGGTSVSRDPEHMSRIGKVGGPIGAARRWGKSAAES